MAIFEFLLVPVFVFLMYCFLAFYNMQNKLQELTDKLYNEGLYAKNLALYRTLLSILSTLLAVPSCPEDRGRIQLHRYWHPQEGSI